MLYEIRVVFDFIPDKVQERGFQPAKTIIQSGDIRFVERESFRVTFFCQIGRLPDLRVGGVPYLGTFVIGFSRCVINGLPDNFHVQVIPYDNNLRVSPGHE